MRRTTVPVQPAAETSGDHVDVFPVEGIVITPALGVDANTVVPNVGGVTPKNSIADNVVHPLNTEFSIVVMVLGITTFVNLVNPTKALACILYAGALINRLVVVVLFATVIT